MPFIDKLHDAFLKAGYKLCHSNVFPTIKKCGHSSTPVGLYIYSNYHTTIDVDIYPCDEEPPNHRASSHGAPYVENGIFYAGHLARSVSEDEWFRQFHQYWYDRNGGLYYFD